MLKPLHKNVILKKDRTALATASGIVLQTALRKPDTAVVTAVGPDVEDQDYGPGDIVVYKSKDPVEFTDGEDEYVIVEDEDILAVKEEEYGD